VSTWDLILSHINLKKQKSDKIAKTLLGIWVSASQAMCVCVSTWDLILSQLEETKIGQNCKNATWDLG
jgi:hypothetical protein